MFLIMSQYWFILWGTAFKLLNITLSMHSYLLPSPTGCNSQKGNHSIHYYSHCDLPSYPQFLLPRPPPVSPTTAPRSASPQEPGYPLIWSDITTYPRQQSSGEGWAIPESLWWAALCPSVLMVQSPLSKATREHHTCARFTHNSSTKNSTVQHVAHVFCQHVVKSEQVRFYFKMAEYWRSVLQTFLVFLDF